MAALCLPTANSVQTLSNADVAQVICRLALRISRLRTVPHQSQSVTTRTFNMRNNAARMLVTAEVAKPRQFRDEGSSSTYKAELFRFVPFATSSEGRGLSRFLVKDGKTHQYWSVVENRRPLNVRQRRAAPGAVPGRDQRCPVTRLAQDDRGVSTMVPKVRSRCLGKTYGGQVTPRRWACAWAKCN
ncbi:MAG: hypothetical protein JWQ50_5284 [Caballeronia mineralivorans]|jgi:hypothetical protein|nr:hypothetical protein [Caballeronia mineralivorans]MEA3100535.1 hypothetical protein [Caballeronia mineralivorans]